MSSATDLSYIDLYKEFYALLGSKIRFTTIDGDYEGIIKFVLPKRHRVTFEHVYYVPTRDYMGTLHFFFREFVSYSVIDSSDKFDKAEKWDYLSCIIDKKFVGNKYCIDDVINADLDKESVPEEYIPYADEIFNDDFTLNLPSNLQSKLPNDSIILESVNTEFHQAIQHISQQEVIGVSFEGPKISRLGKLSWLCISTSACVFLFDIEFLGKDAFDKGLRDIFQNKKIEKVIHDCRQPSDCLTHLFNTELINVFDTQVADFIINMQRYRDKPAFKYVSSLDGCLVNHLDVPQEFLYNRKKKLSYHDEVCFFRIRPISNDYRNAVIKNAIYLVLLKETLSELMLDPFRKAVHVYLRVLANASESELLLDVSVPEMVPPALVLQGIQTIRFQDSCETVPIPLICNFKTPEESNTVNSINLSNNKSENICVEGIVKCDVEKEIIAESPDKKLKKPSKDYQNINTKRISENKSVIIEQMSIQNSKKHIDNVYYRLVNSLNGSDSDIDVKPSGDYVSKFVFKKTLSSSTVEPENVLKPVSSFHSQSNKSEFNNSWDTISDSSSSNDVNTDISSDSVDIWNRLRSSFGYSCFNPEAKISGNPTQKIRFVPAGMST